MLRQVIAGKVQTSLDRLIEGGRLPKAEYPKVEISDTKSPEHGDFACNIALTAAKAAQMNPREVGELIAEHLRNDDDLERVEVAGPGFINLTLSTRLTALAVQNVLDQPEQFFKLSPGSGLKINVEFVSVNPNGPITIGSGRGAAYGSALCNVLDAAGNQVHREFYINDGVNSEQMRLFAESVKHYYELAWLETDEGKNASDMSEKWSLPENGYKGDYVEAVGKTLFDKINPTYAMDDVDEWEIGAWQEESQQLMLERQHEDMSAFGVKFDTWFSEQSLHEAGKVEELIDRLVEKGVADDVPIRTVIKMGKKGVIEEIVPEDQPTDEDDAEGSGKTLWLRSTKFGDPQDRVLRRKDGRLTYIASDVAYHKDKFNRPEGCDKLITVLGPDHHGYIGRLQSVVAALLEQPSPAASDEFTEDDAKIWKDASEKQDCQNALEEAKNKLEVLIFQLVRFVKDGKPAPMRKRDGNIYALIDLIKEIGETVQPDGSDEQKQTAGRDVSRFFYLMRHHDTTFDFDLDLAKKQSDENPVFYVQYAHARICGVIRKAEEAGMKAEKANLDLLDHPKEKALILKLQDLGHENARCAEDYTVSRLTTYAIELARTYHHFYDVCRVVQIEEPELSKARLALCYATKHALKGTFGLLGISSPERM